MRYPNKGNILRTLFFIPAIFGCMVLLAQGPYDYNTPLGKRIMGLTPAPVKETTIYPEQWGSAAIGYDGLTIVTNIQFNPGNNLLKLYTFNNQYAEKYLEVFYKDKTIMLRRYNAGSMTEYYDYILFDPLFFAGQTSTWTVKFYFTSAFFWIQTTLEGQSQNYLSPVYFGVNTLHRKNMDDLIDANRYATIVIGDDNAPADFFVKETSVYAFHYAELKADIDSRFSWPSTFLLDENDEYFHTKFLNK